MYPQNSYVENLRGLKEFSSPFHHMKKQHKVYDPEESPHLTMIASCLTP